MSIAIRPSAARGHADHGWLQTHHTFSFADYYDPAQMGFRALRVINDDTIAAGAGFPTHGHRDMEIVTYLVRGAVAHKDSTGAEGVLHRGDVQAMSAGTGVRHSEFNPNPDEDTRLLQIWLIPNRTGHSPAYRQARFPDEEKRNRLRPIVAPDGAEGALAVHQDARIYAGLLDAGAAIRHPVAPGRGVWAQLVDGAAEVNGQLLKAGDGAALANVELVEIAAQAPTELLLFDLR